MKELTINKKARCAGLLVAFDTSRGLHSSLAMRLDDRVDGVGVDF